MKRVALILAGGKGERMNSKEPKQFLLLNDLPILMTCINRFSDFEKIILVLPKMQFKYWKRLCKKHDFTIRHVLVAGGETRFDSVKNGLKETPSERIVLIHDGVRPLVTKGLICRLVSKVKSGVGVIPVIPITSSIRKITPHNSTSLNRKSLYAVQTPQCFLSSDIKAAYRKASSKNFTDDASVFDASGKKILTISGDEKNLKITTSQDLKIAKALI